MAGGGLMQLVAYGAQDVYLTGNPQITFFKLVHRSHTNFAMESIAQTLNGTPDFGKDNITVTVSRNGDLISEAYLEATFPDNSVSSANYACWVQDPGNRLIAQVELEIGGQRIDRHYAEWLEIWGQLTTQSSRETGYRRMVGNHYDVDGTYQDTCADVFNSGAVGAGANNPQSQDQYYNMNFNNDYINAGGRLYHTRTIPMSGSGAGHPSFKVYVPLIFFFNRNPGLALPFIALQYHEVKLKFQFATTAQMFISYQANNDGIVNTTTTLATNIGTAATSVTLFKCPIIC